jgi:phage/plasmid-like protein (TIGR03299 family)
MNMAHEIESIFFVGETPWHGLGKQLENNPSIEEAIKAADLGWKVELKPVYLEDGTLIESAQATVRDSDGACLGVVGNRYKPLQNEEAFSFFEPFLQNGLCSLETAGSLCGGKKVWVLARIGGSDLPIAGDDVVRKFILLSNSHDGSVSVRVGYTPVRVVCANTLSMAVRDKESQLIRVRHTQRTMYDLEKIRDVMNLVNQNFEASAEQYRLLARKTINAADLRKYVIKVMDLKENEQGDLHPRAEGTLAQVIDLFENGRGNQLIGVRGTVWAAYNAVTEYLSHNAGRSADNRYNALWFGSGADQNALALNEALKLAA